MTENSGKEIQKENAGNPPQDASNRTAEGSEQQSDHIAAATRAAQELKAQNDRLDKNIAELRRLETQRILGGGSPAGQPQKTKEQQQAEEDVAIGRRVAENFLGKVK